MNKFILGGMMLALCACGGEREEASYVQKTFVMSVPAQVKVYGPEAAEGKELADEIFKEWDRISGEFGYTDPYSITSLVNKKAFGEWVKVDDEFLGVLGHALDYYKLTGGAFDITFAPLWPLWKEAASTRKMPAKEDIQKALQDIGSNYIQVDLARKSVRFSRPVQINVAGLLRVYCFERAYRILQARKPAYPVELRLGGDMLVYGKRAWAYEVPDPFGKKKSLGRFRFDKGLVMSSSGRESFVEIEGKLYSHILDLRTGYPIENFSNLVVYFPDMDSAMTSTALAVMGRESAFKVLSGIKGSAALWVDGAGEPSFFLNEASGAKWEEPKGLF